MTLYLLQCPVSGLRHEQDAEEKAEGGDCCVDPEHSVVTDKLYQVGVTRIYWHQAWLDILTSSALADPELKLKQEYSISGI